MDLNTFMKRLGERHIVRFALGYAAGGWIFLEFTEFLAETFGWPGYVVRVALTLVAFGFLAILVVSWFHGEQGAQRVTRTEVALLLLIGGAAAGTSWTVMSGEADPGPDSLAVGESQNEPPLLLAGLDSRDARRALAVLPFVNRSPDPANEYFSDGVTEDIIAHVSRIQGLRVISRTSTMAYKNTDKNIRQIGRELGVDYILEGSVQRSEGQVRIHATLIDARTDEHLWADTFDRELRDILALQAEVAQHIALALSSALGVPTTLVAADRPVDTLAYSMVLQARDDARSEDPARIQQAIARFMAALDRDSTLEVAYSGLAEAVLRDRTSSFGPAEGDVSVGAMRVVERGFDRMPDNPEIQLARVVRYLLDEPDLDRAESVAARVVEQNPNLPEARRWYALVLALTDRHEEGLVQLRSALERDPLNPEIGTDIGEMLYSMGRYEEAVRQLNEVVARHDNFWPARVSLALAHHAAGQTAQAIQELNGTAAETRGNAYVLGTLGYILGIAGQTDSARAVLARLEADRGSRPVPPLALAHVHAGLGNVDEAVRWLDRALEEPNARMLSIRAARTLETISADSAIAVVLRRRQENSAGSHVSPPVPPLPPPSAPGRGRQGAPGR